MTDIVSEVRDNTLYLFLNGRVDSANSQEIENKLFLAYNENPHENTIIDAAKLDYISSAGLRVILRLRKSVPALKIVNVSPEVYDIFDMTGFTEMITIEKAYREMKTDGCEIIGRGANGEVYRIDADTILKVYLNPDSLPDIHRERELARKAFVLGIPTAISYDVVKVKNGYGSVFELLNAQSLNKVIVNDPSKIDEAIGMYVDLLKKIHSTEVAPDDMPDIKKVVLGWVEFLKEYLPPLKWQKLHSLVENVPESHFMIHGDYHLKNVMLQNGEALLIDMDTLSQGDPVFEFASIFNAYIGFSALDNDVIKEFQGISHETAVEVWEKTLRLYFGTDDDEYLKSVENKAALVGYTRLMRRSIRRGGLNDEKGKKEISFYKEQIESLLDKVDDLDLHGLH